MDGDVPLSNVYPIYQCRGFCWQTHSGVSKQSIQSSSVATVVSSYIWGSTGPSFTPQGSFSHFSLVLAAEQRTQHTPAAPLSLVTVLLLQEVTAWYKKYSCEQQGRQVAESALQDTLGEHSLCCSYRV